MSRDGSGGGLGASPGSARRPSGALEAEVMAVLGAAGTPLTPGQVRQRLGGNQAEDLSYSTVVTIMSRLHTKGLLARERAGRAFCYTPVDAASIAARRMSQALAAGADRQAVLTRFVSGLSGRDAGVLRSLLDSDEGTGTGG
jgi:predicted transcriptional regulator